MNALRNTLGHIAIEIYIYLSEQLEPCRVCDISRALGNHRSTISNYLKADNDLVKLGMVKKVGHFYSVQPDIIALEHIAQDTGAYEVQQERANRFDNERQVRLMQIIYKARLQYEYSNMQMSGKTLPTVTAYRKRHNETSSKVISPIFQDTHNSPKQAEIMPQLADDTYISMTPDISHDELLEAEIRLSDEDIAEYEAYQQGVLQELDYDYQELRDEDIAS